MTERLDAAVAPLGVAPGAVRVRTFHALGREILRDAGVAVEPMADRAAVLAAVAPWADEADLLRLDTVDLAAQGRARRLGRRRRRRSRGRARSRARSSPTRPRVAATRRPRLRRPDPARDRPARERPGPARALARPVPGAPRRRGPGRRSCPAPPGAAAGRAGQPDLPRRRRRPVDLRLAAGRRAADPGPRGAPARPPPGRPRGQLPLPAAGRGTGRPARRAQRGAVRQGDPGRVRRRRAGWSSHPTPSDETVRLERAIRSWPDDGSTRAVLARTNRELLPAVVVALELGLPFRAPRIELLLESPIVDELLRLAASAATTPATCRCWSRSGGSATGSCDDPAAARGRDGDARLGGRRSTTSRPSSTPSADARAARRAPTRRRAADARHGARDQGPRVRPRHRRRHGGRPASRARGPSARPRIRSAPTRRNGGSATSRGPGRAGR